MGSGELAQQGGKQADLFCVRSTGKSPAWQLNLQDRRAGLFRDLGNEEGGRVFPGGPRFRAAIHAVKVGYLMPHCRANTGALRLLDSKAATTSCLYCAV